MIKNTVPKEFIGKDRVKLKELYKNDNMQRIIMTGQAFN